MRVRGQGRAREGRIISLDDYRKEEQLPLFEGLRLRLRRGRPELDEGAIERLCSRMVADLLLQFVDREGLIDYVEARLIEGAGAAPPALFAPSADRH
ncbi:hypothetical protein DSOUD_0442 [Desulfuromonas soudanensis]|uniref:Uncharacterized protein n=1 Tax=Desulfuromonas soudanensis TaxID=1603606 RepID=A0A0M5IKD7_9BACT|nr:hypothetical protein [Desulfuromonas soudanensis]ALC15236.1 hypothetical protein DSOUD_0442 [Desulfuromonas soudanensis]